MVVDNGTRRVQPGDLQLYATTPFSLSLTDATEFKTSAFVINYNPEFTVNGFSTDNSVVGQSQKMLWIGKRNDKLYYDPLDPAPRPWLRGITPSGPGLIDVLPGTVGIPAEDALLDADDVDVVSHYETRW